MTKRKYAGNLIYKSNEKISSLILKRLFSIAFSFPKLCSFLLLYIDINVCKYFFFLLFRSETTRRPQARASHHVIGGNSGLEICCWRTGGHLSPARRSFRADFAASRLLAQRPPAKIHGNGADGGKTHRTYMKA